MTFDWNHGLIWITVELLYEEQLYTIDNCILDTGSATTAIDIDLINFNYKKPAEVKRLFGVGGGIQEVVSQSIDTFRIGQIELKTIEIEFGEFQEDLGVNGLVGTDILNQFILTIDFPNRQIDLCSP